MADAYESDPVGSYGPGLVRSIWRYRVAIVAVTVMTAILGYFVSTLLPPVYETTTTIVLSDAIAFGDATAPDPERRVQQEANRLTSRAVFNQAAEELGGEITGDSLGRQVSVRADPTVGVLEVSATSDHPDDAALVANTVARAYEQVARETTMGQVESASEILREQVAELRRQVNELQAQGDSDAIAEGRIATLQAQMTALETRVSEMEANAALFGSGVQTVEAAILPSSPTSPQPMRNAAIAGVVGMAVASAFAYWRAGVVDSAKFDPSVVLGAPLLAEIPQFKRPPKVGTAAPMLDFEATEAYQFLLASFEYAIEQSHARSILVTSGSPGEGKSLTALHLARALAIQGRDVILVDSDIRAHGLTTMLGSEDQPGFVSFAQGSAELDSVIRRYRISRSVQLSVIPAGKTPQQPTGLLGTQRYREALAKITTASDLTIIDGGPLLRVADAAAIAGHLDGILLVVDAKMSQQDLYRVRDRLRMVPTPLLGYILNRVPSSTRVYPRRE